MKKNILFFLGISMSTMILLQPRRPTSIPKAGLEKGQEVLDTFQKRREPKDFPLQNLSIPFPTAYFEEAIISIIRDYQRLHPVSTVRAADRNDYRAKLRSHIGQTLSKDPQYQRLDERRNLFPDLDHLLADLIFDVVNVHVSPQFSNSQQQAQPNTMPLIPIHSTRKIPNESSTSLPKYRFNMVNNPFRSDAVPQQPKTVNDSARNPLLPLYSSDDDSE